MQVKIIELETMYVGGGTPTALNMRQLEKLLRAINQTFTISGEFSFEANPDELTYEKVALLKQYGVNRISMGVQTFKPELLKILGEPIKLKIYMMLLVMPERQVLNQ